MKTCVATLAGICLASMFFSPAPDAVAAQQIQPPQTGYQPLTIKRIFDSEELRYRAFDAVWSKMDPAQMLRLAKSQSATGGMDIEQLDPRNNSRQVLVFAGQLIPSGKTKSLSIDSYQWSSDRNLVLIFTNTKKVWRTNSRGDYWLLNRQSGQLRQIGATLPESSLMFAKFSPDDKQIAFVSDGEIFIESTTDAALRQITDSKSPEIINGTTDWVYEEEFDLKDAIRWSPDSQKIAYWQFDTSGVGEFTLINNTDSLYPTLKKFKHTKTGDKNSAVKIGVLNLADGKTTWVNVAGDPRENYIARARWMSPNRLMLQRLNRDQNENSVLMVDSDTGKSEVLFSDSDAAWVEVCDEMFEVGDSYFTWISERNGWRQVFLVEQATGKMSCLTPGNYDVIELVHVDDRQMYFIASPDNPTDRYLYRIPLTKASDGKINGGLAKRVSPAQSGTHGYTISKDGTLAIHSWSKFGTPPVYDLVSLPDHASQRTYTKNEEVLKVLKTLAPVETSFARVGVKPETGNNADPILLDAWIMKPTNFDASKKYPVVVYVYGEPWGSTVTNEWGGPGYLFHRMLCEQGFVVCSIDNRGTKVPRGRDFRKSIYRQMGIMAPQDQAAAVKTLTGHYKWMDEARVGIWGWSGGGSMSLNAIFKFPDIYKMAVAVAPVSNQAYYDSIYQERYMSTPTKNPEGYQKGSPINYAKFLKGDLLIIHGTADDNCHYQATELLINELIKHNKQFSMMAYPNRSHSINEGANTSVHLRTMILDYFLDHLK